jgi:hypothetical protein
LPFYAVVMAFPYLHMRLRGYRLRHLLMVQGILAVTMPVYLSGVLRALRMRDMKWEVSPKQSGSGLSILRAPQTYVFALALCVGSTIAWRLAERPGAALGWVTLFWLFFYTVSFGHFFFYARNPHDRGAESSDLPDSGEETGSPNNKEAETSSGISARAKVTMDKG